MDESHHLDLRHEKIKKTILSSITMTGKLTKNPYYQTVTQEHFFYSWPGADSSP
jgi:hypothetical protein